MVDYCTPEEVYAYKDLYNQNGTVSAANIALVAELIPECSREIDTFCRRWFYGDYHTRKFDAVQHVYGRKLRLDADLQTATAVLNGNGDSVASSAYVYDPTNETPKHALILKSSSGVSWNYATDPEEAIQVTGTWGFVSGTVPPPPVNRAAIRLVAWRFDQRKAPFGKRALVGGGMVDIPTDFPEDVQRMLTPYRRPLSMVIGRR